MADAEKQKILESEPLCHAHGWLFTPIGWHPWGGVGPKGAAFLTRVENSVFADLRGWPRRNAVLHFRSRLVFELIRFVAHQLRAHEDVAPDLVIDRADDHPPLAASDPGQVDCPRWDQPWDSDSDMEE